MTTMNHPMLLRTDLPRIDSALHGGLHPGELTEVAGAAGIGKSQFALTLAVKCAVSYADQRILYVDAEGTMSIKRLMQMICSHARSCRANLAHSTSDDSISKDIAKRIRVMACQSLSELLFTMRSLSKGSSLNAPKLIIVDSIAALNVKSRATQTATESRTQLLQLVRELKFFSDSFGAFILAVNRASTMDDPDGMGLYTRPALGDVWAHCVTNRLVFERLATGRVITIVKSPRCGYVVQPFVINDLGVKAVHEDDVEATVDSSEFAVHDDWIERLGDLPIIAPSCTLRSTQSSLSAHDPTVDKLEEIERDERRVQEAIEDDDIVAESNDEADDSNSNTDD